MLDVFPDILNESIDYSARSGQFHIIGVVLVVDSRSLPFQYAWFSEGPQEKVVTFFFPVSPEPPGTSSKVKAKSMAKTPPPRTPQPHQGSQSAAGGIAGGRAISSSDNDMNKAVSDFTALVSNDKASSANTAGSSVCVGPASQEKSNQLIRPGRRDNIQPIQGAKSPRLTPTCRLTPTPPPRLIPTPTPRPCVGDLHRSVPRTDPSEGLDPLSSFMMLRSLQRAHVPVVPPSCSSPPGTQAPGSCATECGWST